MQLIAAQIWALEKHSHYDQTTHDLNPVGDFMA